MMLRSPRVVDTSPTSGRRRTSKDALEAEEEAHPPSSAQAPVCARPPARVESVADFAVSAELLRHSPFKPAPVLTCFCSLSCASQEDAPAQQVSAP